MDKKHVIENYHGTEVSDPFRWLEDDNAPETREWTEEQNERTEHYLEACGHRPQIKQMITNLMDYPKYTMPQLVGDYYYFHKNRGLQNQAVFYRTKDLQDGELEVVFDPSVLSDEGTVALTSVAFSKDGKWLAYSLARNGSDNKEIRVKNMESGEDYSDCLQLRRHSAIAWDENNEGFYYSNYPHLDGPADEEASYHNKVFWHRIGTSQKEDVLVFEDTKRKELSYEPYIAGNNLLLRVHNGPHPKSSFYISELGKPYYFTRLVGEDEANYTFIYHEKDVFYFLTTEGAPKGRVIAIDVKETGKNRRKEIIPEQKETLVSVVLLHDYFFVTSMDNVNGKLTMYTKDGQFHREIPVPEHVTVNGVGATKSEGEILVAYTSFLQPTQIIKFHIDENEMSDVFVVDVPRVKVESFETTQVSYPSIDGSIIPMYLVHKKGLELTGDNPVLLYGYGGYKISQTPVFTPENIVWMEAGGIYAVANIRGGGEFGQEWHEAAMLKNKQKTFDDFIAAAEWLIAEGYTKKEKLAIMGGSNGGMVVGACITQRPELFGAALCLVPVTDMLRFHKFTFGRFWLNEFGNAELHAEHFKYMIQYSPLHHVKEGTAYPATFVTTANYDDRVVPLHAKKFAAALQDAQAGDAPILLKEQKNSGHGEGKPTSKIIEYKADLMTFLFQELDVRLPG